MEKPSIEKISPLATKSKSAKTRSKSVSSDLTAKGSPAAQSNGDSVGTPSVAPFTAPGASTSASTKIAPREIKKTTGYFESFDGTSIYYEVRGEGRPLVLCYGLACVMNHWTRQTHYFSQNYQTILFDYRGHHRSNTPNDMQNLSLDALCKDIEYLLRHLNIEKASFWGHSLGAQLLLRYYELYPQTVSNMVFINGFATNPIKGMFGVESMPVVFELFKESYKAFPGALTSFWRTAILNPLAIPLSALAGGFNLSLTHLKDIEVYARGVASLDLNVFIKIFEDMMNFDGVPILSKIQVPVLIISGTKDSLTPVSHQKLMRAKIEGSEFLSVPYGSHCAQLDMPELVNLRAEKFLEHHGYMPRAF
jgi:pimeloyl-ACP methyl ester carboxylesterase